MSGLAEDAAVCGRVEPIVACNERSACVRAGSAFKSATVKCLNEQNSEKTRAEPGLMAFRSLSTRIDAAARISVPMHDGEAWVRSEENGSRPVALHAAMELIV